MPTSLCTPTTTYVTANNTAVADAQDCRSAGGRSYHGSPDITPSVLRRHRHRQRPLVLGATPPEAASHPRCDATVTGSGVSSSSPRARIAIGKADDASLLPVPASAIRTTKILLLLRPRKIQGRQVRTHRIKTNAKSPQDTFPDTARSSPISFARIRPGSCLGMLTKMSK